MKTNFKKQKTFQKGKNAFLSFPVGEESTVNKNALKVGDVLTVRINALGSNNLGLSQLSNGMTIVIPFVPTMKFEIHDKVKVVLEKISTDKPKYATSKLLKIVEKASNNGTMERPNIGDILDVVITKNGPKGTGLVQFSEKFTILVPNTKSGDSVKIQLTRIKESYGFAKIFDLSKTGQSSLPDMINEMHEGTKYHLVLPKTAKTYRDYLVVKIQGSVVFIKMSLGAKFGDTVRIQTMKVGSNYAIAKILKVSPLSKERMLSHTKNRVQKMIQTGMHFGEKAIRCHANMRKYVWTRKRGQNQNRPLLKKDRYYINILKTRRCLTKALKQLAKYAAKGKTFLFVGTKKPAAALIARTALFTKTSFFVNTRWLGGMLTNWKTILKSISQIQPILKEKQKIIGQILEKRRKIQQKFIQKVNLLRKRSQKFMVKGKLLISLLKQNKEKFIEKSQKLLKAKTLILQKNQIFLQEYSKLKMKKKEMLFGFKQLQQQGYLFVYQKQNLLKQFQNNQTKLKEFQQLFLIGQELLKLKKENVLTISYNKLDQLLHEASDKKDGTIFVPNPSKEILNRMIQSMKSYEERNMNPSFMQSNLQNQAKSESGNSVIVLSKLLDKFTVFLPFMKIYIENLMVCAENIQNNLKIVQKNIATVQQAVQDYMAKIKKLDTVLSFVQTKLLSQQEVLNQLKTKLQRLASEQRLLKFLPKLRYLPTPKAKMAQTVQILMKKFVDPKMTIPMEQIYEDKFKFTSKKIAAVRKQKWQRLEKYFGGVTKMAKMSKKQISNNVAIIIGQQEEMNAVRECQKLGIKMFTVVDTNCNPKLSDHIIPANDDSRNSIKFILEEMLTYIRLAQKLRQKVFTKKVKKYAF